MQDMLTRLGLFLGIASLIFMAVFIVIIIIDIFFNAIPLFFTMEGTGTVVKRMNRAAPQQGLWVLLDSGIEIRFPPTQLWDMIQDGDHLSKRRYSLIYTINHVEYNAILYMLRADVGVTLLVSLFFWIVLLGFYVRAWWNAWKRSESTL